jgi:Flp pilus assembly secretin CpaC
MLARYSRSFLIAMVAVAAMAGLDAAGHNARAQVEISYVSNSDQVREVKVGLNKSLVIDLPRDARDILVSNPAIADAVIRTSRRIYVTGIAVGQSNVVIFDGSGKEGMKAGIGPKGRCQCTGNTLTFRRSNPSEEAIRSPRVKTKVDSWAP